ncbi:MULTISPECIES: hypothetical protein [unclassified Streptomyces]|nr:MULTISPECIES: hypothetical protein [unclassified Streptomyces]
MATLVPDTVIGAADAIKDRITRVMCKGFSHVFGPSPIGPLND